MKQVKMIVGETSRKLEEALNEALVDLSNNSAVKDIVIGEPVAGASWLIKVEYETTTQNKDSVPYSDLVTVLGYVTDAIDSDTNKNQAYSNALLDTESALTKLKKFW